MRNNSVWGASDTRQENQNPDLVELLRSPLFYAVAVVVVVVWMIISALSNENWIDAGPIPVVQEKGVVYLAEEGIFVFWNDRDPYGVFEETADGDVAVFCRDAGIFTTAEGQSFDIRGRDPGGGEGLTVAPIRMDGHVVFVNGDRADGEPATGTPIQEFGPVTCPAVSADARGIVR